MLASSPASASYLIPQEQLDAATDIPKYKDPLPEPRKLKGKKLKVDMSEFETQILPEGYFGKTWVYGYGKSYPGPTIEAERDKPTTVIWENKIDYHDSLVQQLVSVDQTLHWADPLGTGCMGADISERPGCFQPYRGPVAAVAHLHGGEVPSAYDGGPDSWYTKWDEEYGVLRGPGFVTKKFIYPNTQEAGTLWYHDHQLGGTRLNVYSGMSGFYLLRDWEQEPNNLPGGPDDCRRGHGHDDEDDDDRHGRYRGDDDNDDHKHKFKHKHGDRDCPYEREIVIQDRLFDTNGQLIFPDEGNNPDIHPFWRSEFAGDVIVVNGKSWPYLDVEPRRYRLRLLNGSNSRGYRLRIQTPEDPPQLVLPVWQIGTDGGLLDKPVKIINPPAGPGLTLGPGERADVIVDFAGLKPGQKLRVVNILPGADKNTTGQVMELRVKPLKNKDQSFDPSQEGAFLRSAENKIAPLDPEVTGKRPHRTRLLTLNGFRGPSGLPKVLLLNNSTWLGLGENDKPIPGSKQISGAKDPRLPYTTELPEVGSTEVWRFVNLTAGGHPIHLHLAQFQVLDRMRFDRGCYLSLYRDEFPGGVLKEGNGPPNPYNQRNNDGEIGGNPAVPEECITGPAMPPAPWERGWKDTVRVPPDMIARIAVRWAPTDLPSMTGDGVRYCPKGDVLLKHRDALPCVPRPGSNLFAFDPSAGLDVKDDGFGYPGGPGYVWHCHILDHEDNEMMRALFIKDKHKRKHKRKHGH
jgi:FtsP/CotA-like multicopper oxidase with cupredoxin domain